MALDKDKIFKGIDCCSEFLCDDCPYHKYHHDEYKNRCSYKLMLDIKQLKDECGFPDTIDRRWEPQKKFAPNFGVNVIVEYQCSECGHFETHQTNYCPQCGCKLKKYEGKEMRVYE